MIAIATATASSANAVLPFLRQMLLVERLSKPNVHPPMGHHDNYVIY
jgi:hypothetical protein